MALYNGQGGQCLWKGKILRKGEGHLHFYNVFLKRIYETIFRYFWMSCDDQYNGAILINKTQILKDWWVCVRV